MPRGGKPTSRLRAERKPRRSDPTRVQRESYASGITGKGFLPESKQQPGRRPGRSGRSPMRSYTLADYRFPNTGRKQLGLWAWRDLV